MQTTSHILMIRPVHFAFNAETAVNNAFQVAGAIDESVQQKARQEFDGLVEQLRQRGVDVLVVEDSPLPHTPDAIFPNNWISFHENGSLVLYPMFAANRRQERKPEVLNAIRRQFQVSDTIDLSGYEQQGLYLEGTGSMILDRDQHICYACLSPRTDAGILEIFCQRMKYKPMLFRATDENQRDIYHTNVMMCVADKYVVICLDSIRDSGERAAVSACIEHSGKEIIPISFLQVNQFAGNMLQVRNAAGDQFLVMSSNAFRALEPRQKEKLLSFNEIIHTDLSTIERNGGGSARCMMAEIFCPPNNMLS